MKIHLYPLPFYCEFRFFGRTVILRKKPAHLTPRRKTTITIFSTVDQYFYMGGRLEIQRGSQSASQKAAEAKLFDDDGDDD